jgi:hypothetical protein
VLAELDVDVAIAVLAEANAGSISHHSHRGLVEAPRLRPALATGVGRGHTSTMEDPSSDARQKIGLVHGKQREH